MIYLDNAATTYPKPDVVYKALDEANRLHAFNIGRGLYPASDEALSVADETRRLLAKISGKPDAMVVFSSSATEALNQIILGLPLRDGDCVYISPFEHNAIVRPLHLLIQRRNIKLKIIPFDKKTWEVNLDDLRNQFAINPPKAIFLSQISNVTGFLLPYDEIFKLSHDYDAINVLDCAQGFGIVPVDGKSVDYIVFAGHKSLYASFGIAGFICMNNDVLNIVKSGGTGSDSLNHDMPQKGSLRYEAGSLNTVAIYGLNASLKWLASAEVESKECILTTYAIERLSEQPFIHLFMPVDCTRILGIVSLYVDGYSPDEVGTILSDEMGIAVRTGYHCAPYVHDFIGSRAFGGTVRISMGYNNSEDDINKLIQSLNTL